MNISSKCNSYISGVSTASSADGPSSDRGSELLEGLQTTFGKIMDDVDTEESDYNSYRSALGEVLFPGIVFAGLIALVALPLFVARCCAHKCCKPRKEAYGMKHKAAASGCCVLWGLVTVFCAIAGISSAGVAGAGVQDELCAVRASLDTSETHSRAMQTSIDALNASLVDFDAALTTLSSSVSTLSGVFASPSGAVTLACAELTAAQTSATSIATAVASAGGGDVATNVPSWGAMTSALQATIDSACTDLVADAQTQAAAAATACADAEETVDDLLESFGEFKLDELIDNLDNAGDDLDEIIDDHFDDIGGLAPLVGLGLFASTLLLFLLAAAPGCALMACTKERHKSCANGCGVFLSGGAWVGTCGYSIVLLVFGTVVLCIGVISYDAAAVLRKVTDPTTLVGVERCARYMNNPWKGTNLPEGSDGLTYAYDRDDDGVAEGSLNVCNVVAGCFGGAAGASLVPHIETLFDVDMSVSSVNASLVDALYSSGVGSLDLSAITSASTQAALTVTSLATISASVGTLCSCAPGSALYTTTTTELASISTNLVTATAHVTTTTGYLNSALADFAALLAEVPPVIAALTAANVALECSWLPDVYLPPFDPVLGDVSDGMQGLALSMLCCGGLGVLFIASLIATQVCLGGVGREPGCPKPCRCCCPGGGVGYSTTQVHPDGIETVPAVDYSVGKPVVAVASAAPAEAAAPPPPVP